MSDPENFGLDVPVQELEPIVNEYSSPNGLSRADIWVLAGMVGCEESQRSIEFRFTHFGRKNCDCTGCSFNNGPPAEFPSPDLTTRQLLQYFRNEFGFSTQQTVAIMGAHTLGEASRRNSGFDGRSGWVDRKLDLDNEYYELLVGGNGPNDPINILVDQAPAWNLRVQDNSDLPNFPNQAVWTRRPIAGGAPLIMVNSDIAVVRDLEGLLDSDNTVDCRFSGRGGPNNVNVASVCPHATETLQFAADYAFDNALWLEHFREAFVIMTSFGYETSSDCVGSKCLKIVEGAEEFISAPPTTAPVETPPRPPTSSPVADPAPPGTASPVSSPTTSPIAISTTASPMTTQTSSPVSSPTAAPESSIPKPATTLSPASIVTVSPSDLGAVESTLTPTPSPSDQAESTGGPSPASPTTTSSVFSMVLNTWSALVVTGLGSVFVL